ncbi:hypothetical protein D3C71_1504610 [compost metagenome]
MPLSQSLEIQVVQDEPQVRLARAMVGERGTVAIGRKVCQQGLDEVEQVVDLLELAARVLVQLSVAGQDVQLFEQLYRLAGSKL